VACTYCGRAGKFHRVVIRCTTRQCKRICGRLIVDVGNENSHPEQQRPLIRILCQLPARGN